MGNNCAQTAWIDRLTICAIPAIAVTAVNRGSLDLRYIESTLFARTLVRLLEASRIVPIKARKFTYVLGDMRLNDETLGTKILRDVPLAAQRILEKKLMGNVLYNKLDLLFPRNKIEVFYEKTIADKIYGLIRTLLIIRWDRADAGRTGAPDMIFYEDEGLGDAILPAIGETGDVTVVLYESFDIRAGLEIWLKPIFVIKNLVFHRKIVLRMLLQRGRNNSPSHSSMIAVHYGHNDLDISKRSDIFWFPDSKIDPERVIIYCDKASHPITTEIAKKIERYSMKWAWKDFPFMARTSCYRIKRKNIMASIRGINNMRMGKIDAWVMRVAGEMAEEVLSSIRFFDCYNVKINLCIGTQSRESIAQSIALDFIDGIRISVQRTRIQDDQGQPALRFNANHIFFAWGREIERFRGKYRGITKTIVSGYPFDRAFANSAADKDSKKIFGGKDVKFVISLFDAGMSRDTVVTEKMTKAFYEKFLQWLLDDNEIALVIKEKRAKRPDELKELNVLFSKAEGTGRCLRTKDPFGRFPSDISHGADMAIGLYLTSALAEAVVTGCRGVYCDLTKSRAHYLYGWGYERIVFDEIDKLIDALKVYKNDPGSMPDLGDWSEHIDEVEPFRDGMGGKRIGTYVRWLLEAFENGARRDKAVEIADTKYVNSWGKDKILSRKDY